MSDLNKKFLPIWCFLAAGVAFNFVQYLTLTTVWWYVVTGLWFACVCVVVFLLFRVTRK